MKNILPLLYGVALLPIAASGQSTSNVVGYVSLGDTTGTNPNAVPATTDQRITIPLLNPTKAVGTISPDPGDDATVVTVDGAAYTDDEWIGHYLQVTSGANEGQIVVVTDNDATTLTIMPQGDENINGVVDGDTFALSLAWTIDSAIGDQPVGTQLLAFTGTGAGTNLAPDITYEFGDAFGLLSPDQWFDAGSLTAAGNAILYPAEALIIRADTDPINSLVISGEVPTAKHYATIKGGAAAQDTPMGYMSPVGEPVIDASLPVVVDDQLLLFDPTETGQNKAPVITYQYGDAFGLLPPNTWYDAGSLTALDATNVLPGGESFIYRRAAAAMDTTWTDEQSYYGTL